MADCRTLDDLPLVVGVEGKSTEPFDEPIQEWVVSGGVEPAPTRLRRLQYLSRMLGVHFPQDSPLRYQLVHRTASIVSEAARYGAVGAVVLVHSFVEQPDDNWVDFQAFIRHLGTEPTPKNTFTVGVFSDQAAMCQRISYGLPISQCDQAHNHALQQTAPGVTTCVTHKIRSLRIRTSWEVLRSR